MTERVYGSHLPKECCQFVYGDCNGTIDMHFILLVYKYEYIMNKKFLFRRSFDIVWYFPV